VRVAGVHSVSRLIQNLIRHADYSRGGPSDMRPAGSGPSTALYVARQPIFDNQGRVFGYELLYREAAGDTTCSAEHDLASARVLTSAVLDLGLETLTAGRLAFVNVTGALLLDGIDTLVPAGRVVLELLETMAVTSETIGACRDLRARGHLVALDDFVPGSPAEALLPYASFVKVDMLDTAGDAARTLADRLRPSGVTLLAEKVESREILQGARDAGYSLFQGFFFCKPIITVGASIPAQKMAYLRLLAALNRPDLTTSELETLVKQDLSLSLRVLRFVNSAAVPTRTEVRTIGQALFLIGMEPIRRWASVWCLAGLSTGATPELSTLALVRARACELVSEDLADLDPSELFLVGLCSLLDVMLGQPMEDTLGSLPLSSPAAEALLGGQNRLRAVLDAIVAHEAGAWDQAAAAARRANVPDGRLPIACTRALRWAHDVSGSLAAPI
jgi:EAL and modified HD-GYP domain-containing signal transduction protein